ncbi:sphingomyelin phosphodiesterase 5-like [Arapaima gigas]
MLQVSAEYGATQARCPPHNREQVPRGRVAVATRSRAMALRESPFPNGFAEGLHAVAWGLIAPCFWSIDRLLAVCRSTSLERRRRREQECYLHPLRVFFGALLFLALLLLSAPIALLGFLLWAPLQAVRRPFSYHRGRVTGPEAPDPWPHGGDGAAFSFVSANVCLLTDGLARFNNLSHTQRRAAAIGHLIVQGVSRPRDRSPVVSPGPANCLLSEAAPGSYGATDTLAEHPGEARAEGAGRETRQDPASPSGSNPDRHADGGLGLAGSCEDALGKVSALFPANVDIVCLEEVFDRRAARRLKEALSPVLGHVLYDVGVYGFQPYGCCSFKFFNSGLFVATRYAVLEAEYRCFPNGRGEDALAAKGLLCIKVLIGQDEKQKPVIGYYSCTHLHAPEGEGQIRTEQLTLLMQWIEEFQTRTREPEEVVVFDVLSGDFNFDNCSPDDTLEQKHHIFQHYKDPCRAGPGKEKPWVIGTLLEQPTLYEEEVNTPERLQKTLEKEELRKLYVSPPVPLAGCPLVYPESGSPWVGRRIDYVLYRESTLAEHCCSAVEEITFVTQFAGLTDHIPVGLKMNVTVKSDARVGNKGLRSSSFAHNILKALLCTTPVQRTVPAAEKRQVMTELYLFRLSSTGDRRSHSQRCTW